jgi:protein phosphatase
VTGLALQCAARSDVGRRANNEDAVLVSPRLAAVADGVGGAAAGEVASRTVINALAQLDKTLLDGPLDDALGRAVLQGNDTVNFLVSARPKLAGMSTTLTAVALGDDGAYLLANVGDSRTYLLRDGELRRLSRDDSLVQELVDRGLIASAEARAHPQRSVVTAALDGSPRQRPTVARLAARAGDRLLLCSDGLSDVVDDDEIASVLRSESARDTCADGLVALALAGGGRDNVSVVVADVVERAGDGWAEAGAAAS